MTEEKQQDNKEFRILRAMKIVLTGVVRDTAVPPGHKHPLSDNTIEDIRQCLMLISSREQELLVEAGEEAGLIPRFTDEPQAAAVVPISKIGRNTRKDKD